MQLDLQAQQSAAQDAQMRLQLTESTQKELMQNEQALQMNQAQLMDKQRQFQQAEFAIGERNRQMQSAALGEKAQVGEQVTQAATQIEQALEKGNTQLAMQLAQQAAQGLIGSRSADTATQKALEDMLTMASEGNMQLTQQSELAEDQFDYTQNIAELQQRAQMGDLNAARAVAELQAQAQDSSLRIDRRLTKSSGRMAQRAIRDAASMRRQQDSINRRFNEAGYNIQASNLATQNASQLAQIQAQGAMARAQQPGLLSTLGQLGGAISGLIPMRQPTAPSVYTQQVPQQPIMGTPLTPFTGPVNQVSGSGFTGSSVNFGGF
jgi:hypothetical protein